MSAAAKRPIVAMVALTAVVLGFSAVPATPAAAQSVRVQVPWVAGEVAGMLAGVEGRLPLGPEPEIPLPTPGGGPVEVPTRDWMLTGMAGAGANFRPSDGGVELLLQAHVGVLRRTGSDLVSRAGVVVVGYLLPEAIGPAAHINAFAGAVGLQAGALRQGGGWRGHIALDVSGRFICDLVC
jgi:hypothetical protein